jgi:Arc/MetJ-type ribon-helix-helix transcriptional regulator
MSKTRGQYEELFEDLMEYTDFKSSDEIRTKQDLYDFFGQVKDDAESKGRKFQVSSKLYGSIAEVIRLGVRKFKRKSEKLKRSKSVFKSYKAAKSKGMTARNTKGKEIYKTSVKIKGKSYIKYRDKKGRFVKNE